MPDPVDAVKRLKDACDRAYDKWPNSCSDAVWNIIKELVSPGAEQIPANDSVDYWNVNWQSVSLEDGYNLANKGVLVVGGAKVLNGHGHVIAIYPGPKKANGGYQYFYKKANKYLTLPGSGMYPRALSTSMSRAWPGAMSKGDKTVWDPWGSDKAFEDVEFWAPPASF
jgi:hypothetical protein